MSAAKYFVRQADDEFQVDIEEQSQGALRVWLNGKERQVDVQDLPGGMQSLLIDGVSYDVDFEQAKAKTELETALNVLVHHSVVPVTVMNERHHRLQELAGSSAAGLSSGEISSPMPGKVIKYLVAAGEQVKSGQGLVVVEAMKMENEISSPLDGEVSELRAEPGAAVESGAILMLIKAEGE